MSIDPSTLAATLQLPAALSGTAPLLRFQSDGASRHALEPGQMLQARVLQSFQGGRYLLDVAGEERVVDSSLPLRVGETFRARVLAVGEQVVLERLRDAATPRQELPQDAARAPPAWLQRTDDEIALALFRQHGPLLTQQEWQALAAQAGGVDAKDLVLSALATRRAGLPLDPALLNSLIDALSGESLAGIGQEALSVNLVAGAQAEATRDNAQELAASIDRQLHQAQGDHGADIGAGNGDGDTESGDQARRAWIAQRLLNAQQPGALAHRMMSLPLAIDGRLVEFRIALFDVSGDADLTPELRQRSLRIALDLDGLGKIDLLARVVDSHVRVDVLAASEAAAATLGGQDRLLSRALGALGWTLDGASYAVKPSEAGDVVVRTVMERIVAGDNFNMVA
jgi:hypothetical protein